MDDVKVTEVSLWDDVLEDEALDTADGGRVPVCVCGVCVCYPCRGSDTDA